MNNKTKIITIITATIITFIASMALMGFIFWYGGMDLKNRSFGHAYCFILSIIISCMIASYPKGIIENMYKEKDK